MTDSLSDCSSWSNPSSNNSPQNLFRTLSRNIQRYESEAKNKQKPFEFRCTSRKPSLRLGSGLSKKESRTLYPKKSKQNQEPPHYQKIKVMGNFLEKPMLVSVDATR